MLINRTICSSLLLVAGLLVGCGQIPGAKPGISIPVLNNASVAFVAEAKFRNWSSNLVHDPRVDVIRQQTLQPLKASRGAELKAANRTAEGMTYSVQGLSDFSHTTLASAASGEPAFDYMGTAYFVAANGDVYSHSTGSSAAPAYQFTIKDTSGNSLVGETFPKSRTLALPTPTGESLLLLCSAQGTLFVVNATTHITADAFSMGGSDSDVGFTAPPYIDFMQSDWSSYWKLYAVTNHGLLHRFTIDSATGAIGNSPDTLQLPVLAASNAREELYRTAPIVYNGVLSIGSWKRHKTNASGYFDLGGFYSYDLSTLSSSTPPVMPSATISKALPRPIFAPPSVDTDGYGIPRIAVVPNDSHLLMVDLTNQSNPPIESPDLLVNPDDFHAGSLENVYADSSKKLISGIQSQPLIFGVGRVLVANCNAQWKLNFASPTYNNEFTQDAWNERAERFGDPSLIFYCKSRLGDDSGTTDSEGKYIYNNSNTFLYDGGVSSWMIDSNGNAANGTATSLTQFDPKYSWDNMPPSQASSYELVDTAGGAQIAGQYIDWGSSFYPLELVFLTTSNTNNVSTPKVSLWRCII